MKFIHILFSGALFCFFFEPTLTLAQNNTDETLASARKFVDDKSYASALNEYAKIKETLQKDPGLLIEWARVYTYADRHIEAIKLFEEVRAVYPEKTQEILRGLADQYKWNGQLRKSINIYRQALKKNPENPELRMGLAEALSWADNLEEANQIYREILDQDPKNIDALNNQARNMVWEGYHKKGIKKYKEILETTPNNPDALEGMAFAFHWDGQNSKAVSILNQLLATHPDRREAQKLDFQIKNSQKPFIKEFNDFFKDTNPQTATTNGLRSGFHLDYATSADLIYGEAILRKKGSANPTIAASQEGVGIARNINEKISLNTFLYATQFTKVDFNPFTTNTWLTYKPDDLWRFDLAYDREIFRDNDALTRRIITNGPSLSMDFRPDRFWFFNIKYKRGFYSDENTQDQIFGKTEFRLSHKPYIKLYYNTYYSDWGEPRLNNGYFNISHIYSHALGLYASKDITEKLFVEGQASGGYEFQNKPDPLHKISNHPTCYAAGGLSYRLSENWLISARGEFFTTWPDHGQKSYIQKSTTLSLTYNFGANPPTLQAGSQPYRATSK